MQCPSCSQETEKVSSFCEKCGARLLPSCPSCDAEVSSTARFRANCGEPLAGSKRIPWVSRYRTRVGG